MPASVPVVPPRTAIAAYQKPQDPSARNPRHRLTPQPEIVRP